MSKQRQSAKREANVYKIGSKNKVWPAFFHANGETTVSSTSTNVNVLVMVELKKKKNRSLWLHPILLLREEVSEYFGIWPLLQNVCRSV